MDLENILRDPRYKDATFVLIHGGYPYDQQSIWLASLANVYLDSSEFILLVFPTEYSHILRRWLEIFSEKTVFGSGAFPYSMEVNVPATYWLSVQTARTALAAALAEMVSAGEITETKALAIARGCFDDNTAKLFGLPTLPVRSYDCCRGRQLSARR
jgi:predicted TIM-barrel fold metal-dependent hydrolase